ncbi:MAG TPA: hypothetical protein VFF30_13945 [Nitrososphaerales archaeon]|nr:hypothetical protein [Nitrososphaerales archaeon]
MELIEIVRCIDNALERFGSGGRQRFYWKLMTESGLPFDRLLTYPEQFAEALEKILGEEVSEVVERSIVKEIKNVFGLKHPSSSYTLAEALEVALRKVAVVSEVPLIRE